MLLRSISRRFRMRRLIMLSACIAFVTAVPLLAQWPDYPTVGVPRDAKGKPDLNGPTPKAADGHPDLSGVWGLDRMGGGRAGAAAAGNPPPGGPPAPGATPPPP